MFHDDARAADLPGRLPLRRPANTSRSRCVSGGKIEGKSSRGTATSDTIATAARVGTHTSFTRWAGGLGLTRCARPQPHRAFLAIVNAASRSRPLASRPRSRAGRAGGHHARHLAAAMIEHFVPEHARAQPLAYRLLGPGRFNDFAHSQGA